MSEVIKDINDLKDDGEVQEFEVSFSIESDFLLIDSGLLSHIHNLGCSSNVIVNKLSMTYDFDAKKYEISIKCSGVVTNIQQFTKLVQLLYERQMNDSIGAANEDKERRLSEGTKVS